MTQSWAPHPNPLPLRGRGNQMGSLSLWRERAGVRVDDRDPFSPRLDEETPS